MWWYNCQINFGREKIGNSDLTQGELGTRGTNETKAIEAKNAAEILGISARKFENGDGFLINSEEYQLKIIKTIRTYQPEIVFAMQ